MLHLLHTAIVSLALLTAQPVTGSLIPFEVFEDGSWIAADGSTGCFAGEICAEEKTEVFEDGSYIFAIGNDVYTGCLADSACNK